MAFIVEVKVFDQRPDAPNSEDEQFHGPFKTLEKAQEWADKLNARLIAKNFETMPDRNVSAYARTLLSQQMAPAIAFAEGSE